MKHTNIRSFIRARVNYNKILSVSLSVIIVISLFTSPAFANVSVNTGSAPLQPQVSGSFPVSAENAGSYVEPANTFSDGSPTYYLVTQDASKAAWTSVTYDGVDYTLAAAGGVKVTNDIKTIGAIFAANTTIFFDSGTYNDADETAYTRFSADNLSLVGLYGASSTSITKSAHATDGTIERNIIYARNIYMQGITFDGLGRNMCQAAAGSGYGKNRGEYYFYISGKEAPWTSSDNFVMKDCVIQNIGSNNSSSAKNLAINIYS